MNYKQNNITETHRLIIDECRLEDDAFYLDLLNQPSYHKFIGDRGVRSLPEAREFIINSILPAYSSLGFGLYVVRLKTDLKPIGVCGLVKRTYLDFPDIGFAYLEDHQGKGYGFEAGEAIKSWAIEELKLEQLYGITSPDNKASQALLCKLGLQEKELIKTDTDSPSLLFALY